ncbi:MAG: menaquinone biosynthesis protein [Selenomonas sp.]|uniref:menaquinone biosynthetic enzyme MqnA/MqnD family protein n=1 Tax=Selenomonas sp. TaxID=2053611 RepID=UPI0025FBADA6|nr:menaquinone biosynthesis protein [Selenomonas sp.]MCR5757100.1 menaquinone biosynthesis protein [Selenomonas sp.]
MTCPRVGHIDFLNVLPLSYSYNHGASQGLTITRGVPAVLNNDLITNRLDMSNSSSIVYARHSDKLLILPDVCVSTDGAVQSILLISKKPIEDLKDDKIILTAKSATSHCLLKIILRSYGAIPNYYVRHVSPETPVPDDASAALLIGDDALWCYHHKEKNLYYYDLGLEWQALTGKKMVYALWVVNHDFAENNPEMLQLIYDRVTKAFRQYPEHKHKIIGSVLEDKPFTPQQLDSYLYNTIKWNLNDEYIEGLETFYALAHNMNLIEHIPALNFAKVRRN